MFSFEINAFKIQRFFLFLKPRIFTGGAHLHQFDVHGHVDGEELLDGVRLPQDQGVLQGKARTRVPGNFDQEYQQYLEYQLSRNN